MKIKIKDELYDTEDEPIMIIFKDHEEKMKAVKLILNMVKDSLGICYYPNKEEWIENNYEKIKSWMFCNCSEDEYDQHPEYKNLCVACGKPRSI